MKYGYVINKQSISPIDVDSIIFYRPKPDSLANDSFIDFRDGNRYKFVVIGDQVWMAENLRYLPKVNAVRKSSLVTPHYYVYGYDGTEVDSAKSTENDKTFGVLYNWSAAMADDTSSSNVPSGIQGACPEGWHLPSNDEWGILEAFVESDYNSREDGKGLKSLSGWNSNGNGTDHYGFNGLPSGSRSYNDSFRSAGYTGSWWSSTEREDADYARIIALEYFHDFVLKESNPKDVGLSVRCVKN